MTARWVFVRLSAAEKALRQGRVDDAYAAAVQPELREHPRAQGLLDELVRPLLARARLHRQAGRYREALADLERLAAVGRAGPEVQTFRQQIVDEMTAAAAHTAEQRDAYACAADHLRAGRLETCRLDLERVDDTRWREQLADELEHRLERGGRLLAQAEEALGRDDVLGAVRFWQEACRRHGRTRESDALASRLTIAYRQAVERWHADGRIERVLAAHDALEPLLSVDPALSDCERLVALCARASSELAAADYAGLRQTMLRLSGVGRDVPWVNEALEALNRISEGRERLMASPLGLLGSMATEPSPGRERGGLAQQAFAVPIPVAGAPGSDVSDPDALRLDRPLLVLVDGGGSSLLIRRERVRIGRAGGSVEVDVALPGDIQSHHADVVHGEEECFLAAYGPAQVNRRPVEQGLLRDGDRIVLGTRAKMVYCRPSAKSESAVLRLSHACRLPQDVSDIVLFRDTCLIGSDPGSHIRTREGGGQVVLFERDGALYARQIAGGGAAVGPAGPVIAGQTLEFGELRLTVKPYG